MLKQLCILASTVSMLLFLIAEIVILIRGYNFNSCFIALVFLLLAIYFRLIPDKND